MKNTSRHTAGILSHSLEVTHVTPILHHILPHQTSLNSSVSLFDYVNIHEIATKGTSISK